MHCCRTVCNLMPKQGIGLCYSVQFIKRGYKASGSSPPNVRHNGHISKFILVRNTFELGKIILKSSMNFSAKGGARPSRQGSNQDKEKMKNYIVFGGLMLISLIVFIVNERINRIHHDHVYIEIPKEKK